jgi:hypothetical protein
MNVTFPIIELVDRYSIAQLKYKKTQANLDELNYYADQMAQLNLDLIETELVELEKVHSEIWSRESELKSGLEHRLSLEDIGRKAIEIRDWNNKRVALKNIMADKLGQSNIHDIKKDHLSE